MSLAIPQMGRGSRPPGFSPKRSRAVQTLGSYPGPGSRVWLSCSQGVLAVESASHEAQVRGSQKNAFPTHIVRLRVWETKLFFLNFFIFEYIIQAVIKPSWERYGMRNRGQGGNVTAKKSV